MLAILKAFVKQPYWIVALILGVFLIALPCVTIDKDYSWNTHPPTTPYPIVIGCALLVLSFVVFMYVYFSTKKAETSDLDCGCVREVAGIISTTIGSCEIRVLQGRIEEYSLSPDEAVALPCNEYFDDQCAHDVRSALGAYVNRAFRGRVGEFVSLGRSEALRKFGAGQLQQKTEIERAESFGAGRCILLAAPLGSPTPVALISTTTQRAGQGLSAQISCLFQGMHELSKCLADTRISKVAMPVMGGGHGGVHPHLAFFGLVLAVAEAARYGHGAQRPRTVSVVVFKKDAQTSAEVDPVVIRRALALVGSQPVA